MGGLLFFKEVGEKKRGRRDGEAQRKQWEEIRRRRRRRRRIPSLSCWAPLLDDGSEEVLLSQPSPSEGGARRRKDNPAKGRHAYRTPPDSDWIWSIKKSTERSASWSKQARLDAERPTRDQTPLLVQVHRPRKPLSPCFPELYFSFKAKMKVPQSA